LLPSPNQREKGITMNPSVSPADGGEVAGRRMDDALVERDWETVDQLIARVLRGAHQTAHAVNAPDEARAILHLAHSFAYELASTNPRFDRQRFIRVATEDGVGEPLQRGLGQHEVVAERPRQRT
jgi:hypothetical protein